MNIHVHPPLYPSRIIPQPRRLLPSRPLIPNLRMGHFLSLSAPSSAEVPRKTEADTSSETVGNPLSKGSAEGLPLLEKAKGYYWYPRNGERILDACGGAGVACIGHARKDVAQAAVAQMKAFSYVSYAHFKTKPVQEVSDWLINSTGGEMQKVYLMCSGSEAVEAALKLSREYFIWKDEPQRVNFIGREESYHGTTIGSLSASGHVVRRGPFEPILVPQFHKISSCNPYRQRRPEEDDEAFATRKAAELEEQFQRLGPDTVAAVIMEPVVGAALGCVPAVPGYLRAMKVVCEKYGALLIFDEVMCGMGRTGVLHAWQHEMVVPDLQTIGKGFAGGYMPASALLVGAKVAELMKREDRTFTHGHTYQNHPVVSATALKVQKIIQEDNLVSNVETAGHTLEQLLHKLLGNHPNVGDIRGRGLFWGIEFVQDKTTKEPFDPALQVAHQVFRTAMRDFRVLVYHGQGCAGGGRGDHIMIMPAYNMPETSILDIVERVACAVEKTFGGS
ncbi:pyridoxal phosphate-dependent transferase [Lasiosphaeria hispida]|uniref:Pyridoxal phosphate-dependent transferase n=1 Tax=Lasiosphaeria hispida TaxID=260671 RepID=A0AAJ0MG08_9PEZI|nr:pyridoxal phosphate-dependent transferase [Lasiosphaeria hispida]